MPQFGYPARNATTDANAGIINPPARKAVATQTAVPQQKKQITSLDTGVQTLGASLGEALIQQVDKRTSFIAANHAMDLDIEAEFGIKAKSMKELDDATGWRTAYGGKRDISNRELQQRASDTKLHQSALELSTSVGEYAGISTDEYKETILRPALNKILETHQGDPDSQRKLAHSWIKSARKLAGEHIIERDAYAHIQLKEDMRSKIRVTSDQALVDNDKAATATETAEAIKPMSDMFTMGQFDGMTKEATDAVLGEEIAYSLEQGNVGMFNAATVTGFFKGKSPQYMNQLEASAKVYSSKLVQESANLRNEADHAANSATKASDVIDIYDALEAKLEQVEERTIKGFTPANIIGEQTKADATERTFLNRFRADAKARDVALKKASKEQAKVEHQEVVKAAVFARQNNQPNDPSLVIKKKEYSEALDSWITDGLTELHGEDMDSKQLYSQMFLDDASMQAALKYVGRGDKSSNIVPAALATIINGDHSAFTMQDDERKFSPVAQDIVGRIRQLGKAINLEDAMGEDLTSKYYLMVNAIESGSSVDRMHKDMELIDANASQPKTSYQPVFGTDKKAMTKTTHIASILSKRRNANRRTGWFINDDPYISPTREDLADAERVYNTGLAVGGNDASLAEEYLNDWLKNSQTPIKIGDQTHDVSNLKDLTKELDFSVSEVLDFAARKNKLFEHIKGIRGNTETAKDEKPILNLGEIPNLQVQSVLGRDALFFNTVASPNVFPINYDEIRLWNADMIQEKNFAEQERADFIKLEADNSSLADKQSGALRDALSNIFK